MRRMKKILAVTLAGIMLFSLSGCGSKKDKTDISADLESIQDASESGVPANTAESSQTAEGEGISFELKTKGGIDVTVENLTIENQIAGSGKIYDVNSSPMTDEEVAKLAEKFFDGGEYEIVTPYSVASDEELKAERDYYTNLYEKFKQERGEEADSVYNSDCLISANARTVLHYLEWTEPREEYSRKEGEILCPVTELNTSKLGREGDDWSDVWGWGYDNYRHGMLRGMVNGELWMMEILVKHGEISNTDLFCYKLSLDFSDAAELSLDSVNETVYGANRSDRAVCEEKSAEMLARLGIVSDTPYYVQQAQYSRMVGLGGEEKGESYMDGYFLYYGLWNEDFPRPTQYENAAMLTSSQNGDISSIPGVIAIAEKNEAQCVYVRNFVQERTPLSAETALLSEDTVLERVKEHLDEYYTELAQYGNRQGETIKNPRMVLTYCMLPYPGEDGKNHDTLMPVWLFLCSTGASNSWDFEFAMFGICAVDGEQVTLGVDTWTGLARYIVQ